MSFQTAQRTPLFRHERWLILLLNVMDRHKAEFVLHDYIVMPDHVHLLITPIGALERTIQLIKGGFSFQARREFKWTGAIWQEGFSDHRIRDKYDFHQHEQYIVQNLNSLGEGLRNQRGRHSSTRLLDLAPIPQRLKPVEGDNRTGGTEVPPLQSTDAGRAGRQNSTDAECVGKQKNVRKEINAA